MNYIRPFYLSFIIVLYASCGSQKSLTNEKFEDKIVDLIGEDYKSEYNENKTYLLTWNLDESADTPLLKYAVWETQSSEKIYSDTAIRGEVSWFDNTTLEVYDYPGIIDDHNPLYRYKIDLVRKKKTAFIEKDKH